jgi:ppGpp synthetase/RelA/SpoT-type nucleotidyltranferase
MADGTPIPAWDAEYRSRVPVFDRLAEEVEYALEKKAESGGIKTHTVSSRVKTAESVAEKAKRKELDDPLQELDDLVGIRVVVLFLSELPLLDGLIRETFTVHSSDDKIADGDAASFGYMSIHYVATLGDGHSGSRYEGLDGIRFEIQTRTVVMDAWANASHHLDYKGQSSIPEDLRRDFFALSGLFYVADQHFEIFAGRSRESQEHAEQELTTSGSAGEVGINLDTVEAFLRRRYPDRDESDRASISEFVEEISRVGYETIGALDAALTRGESAFESYEMEYPPGPPGESEGARFLGLGAARITLAMGDPDYALDKYGSDSTITAFSRQTQSSD